MNVVKSEWYANKLYNYLKSNESFLHFAERESTDIGAPNVWISC